MLPIFWKQKNSYDLILLHQLDVRYSLQVFMSPTVEKIVLEPEICFFAEWKTDLWVWQY